MNQTQILDHDRRQFSTIIKAILRTIKVQNSFDFQENSERRPQMVAQLIAGVITFVGWWVWSVFKFFMTNLFFFVIVVVLDVVVILLFLYLAICLTPSPPPSTPASSRQREPTSTRRTRKRNKTAVTPLSVNSDPPPSLHPSIPASSIQRDRTRSTLENMESYSPLIYGSPPSPPSSIPDSSIQWDPTRSTLVKMDSYSPLIYGSPPSRPASAPSISTQREPTFTWSKQEAYEATASAFSVITGVKIISERDVQKQRELGKKVTPLEIKDVFYGRLSSTQTNQEQLYYIPDSAYDPPYDYDFTNYKEDDSNCTRGDYPYQRPAGWNRKAVKVIGKYEDDVWLGQPGMRDESSPGEWPVSYHGTKIDNVPSIVAGGYDTTKCERKAYGPGIYSAPDIKVAEEYATDFNYKGENYRCILQNRVNLKKTKKHKTPKGIYFRTPDEDDIRPYGVCIKKI